MTIGHARVGETPSDYTHTYIDSSQFGLFKLSTLDSVGPGQCHA